MTLTGTIKQSQLAAITHNRQVVARFRALAQTPRMICSYCISLAPCLRIFAFAENYQDSYVEFLKTSTSEIEALQD